MCRQWASVTRHWCRLRNMSSDRLNKRVFTWGNTQPALVKNWNYRVRKKLDSLESIHIGEEGWVDVRHIVHCVEVQSFEQFIASWTTDLMRENARYGQGRNKLRTYRTFKTEYGVETYTTEILKRNHRSALAKFRCGVASIRVETGRYEHIPLEQRVCFNCKCVEDEIHVLLVCPMYRDTRENLLNGILNHIVNWRELSDSELFSRVMSSRELVRICAKTCSDILDARNRLLFK